MKFYDFSRVFDAGGGGWRAVRPAGARHLYTTSSKATCICTPFLASRPVFIHHFWQGNLYLYTISSKSTCIYTSLLASRPVSIYHLHVERHGPCNVGRETPGAGKSGRRIQFEMHGLGIEVTEDRLQVYNVKIVFYIRVVCSGKHVFYIP